MLGQIQAAVSICQFLCPGTLLYIYMTDDGTCISDDVTCISDDAHAYLMMAHAYLIARTHTHWTHLSVASCELLNASLLPKIDLSAAAALVRAPNCQELMLAGRVGAGTQPAAALGSPLPMCVFSVCL